MKVNQAIAIDGQLVEIGPECRFGGLEELYRFYEQYPKVKAAIAASGASAPIEERPEAPPFTDIIPKPNGMFLLKAGENDSGVSLPKGFLLGMLNANTKFPGGPTVEAPGDLVAAGALSSSGDHV